MKKIVLLLAGLTLLFTLTVTVAGSDGLGVSGIVTGRDGVPKALVGVNFTGPDNFTALTDSQGRFQLSRLTPGRYRVTVSQGTNRQQFVFELRGGEQLQLKVGW